MYIYICVCCNIEIVWCVYIYTYRERGREQHRDIAGLLGELSTVWEKSASQNSPAPILCKPIHRSFAWTSKRRKTTGPISDTDSTERAKTGWAKLATTLFFAAVFGCSARMLGCSQSHHMVGRQMLHTFRIFTSCLFTQKGTGGPADLQMCSPSLFGPVFVARTLKFILYREFICFYRQQLSCYTPTCGYNLRRRSLTPLREL